jgi:hypothetical protein
MTKLRPSPKLAPNIDRIASHLAVVEFEEEQIRRRWGISDDLKSDAIDAVVHTSSIGKTAASSRCSGDTRAPIEAPEHARNVIGKYDGVGCDRNATVASARVEQASAQGSGRAEHLSASGMLPTGIVSPHRDLESRSSSSVQLDTDNASEMTVQSDEYASDSDWDEYTNSCEYARRFRRARAIEEETLRGSGVTQPELVEWLGDAVVEKVVSGTTAEVIRILDGVAESVLRGV